MMMVVKQFAVHLDEDRVVILRVLSGGERCCCGDDAEEGRKEGM